MQVQAHFSGIQQALTRHLEGAAHCVRVLACQFTDNKLFEALLSCQRRGVAVSLIISDCEVNRQSSIAWERLSAVGGRIFRLPEGSDVDEDFDRSFCLIDNASVISGDFEWTRFQDATKQVSILIQCDEEIVEYFERTFARLAGEPWQASVRTGGEPAQFAASILEQGAGLSLYQDPELEELRLRARMMEARVLAVDTEIADVHRQIHLFDHQQERAIGDLTRRYLDLKRRYLHARYLDKQEDLQRQQAQAADDIYRQYQEAQTDRSMETEPEQLDPQQQRELKQLYRQLAMRCHPDRVSDEDKGHAKVLFQQLQLMFQNSDLDSLKKLKTRIEAGLSVKVDRVSADQFELLQQHLKDLQQTLAQRNQQLASVCQSASWRDLSSKPDWSQWFNQQAERLKAAMQHYMTELNQVSQELRA